jgi:catechol 2,3-dioxygenase-like lactoylglutathione lyase family enzyme
MKSPIINQIGSVFIPVSDIEKARDWYCDLLGLNTDREIQFGHLYVIPMEGTGIVLDSKIYSEAAIFKAPMFHFNTLDIEDAFSFMKNKGVNVVSDIQHHHYFNFTDPDGNMLMICKC